MDVVNLLMNDNARINYRQLACVEAFVIVPLTFIGFNFVNGILSSLESFLTTPNFQPQIDSFEDIYRSNLKIFTFNDGWKNHLIDELEEQSPHGDWVDKVGVINTSENCFMKFVASTRRFHFCEICIQCNT